MAWILRKLFISMLIPYLWRRWRDRDRAGALEGRSGDVGPRGTTQPHGGAAPR
ncbi:MAG: hypothetical protein ACLGI8_02070 [Acidimicrobiia bacterium]|jgi:hypothetical protein